MNLPDDPVYHVVPTDVFTLKQNSWNPNTVFNTELALLEESILENRWLHPIIINANGVIIDGYHRHWLAKNSQKIMERDAGLVPCVILDISDREAMMMTVRINRAKGTHGAMPMRDLVRSLIDDYGVTPEEMVEKMGMTESEVGLLYEGSLLKKRNLQNHKYSKAWVPIETTHEVAPEFERDVEDG
jgi:ParB-like chromosome segregation protein Spo0J